MEVYEVTLLVTREPEDSPPDEWEWQELVDSPHPVPVLKVTKVKDGTTEG